MERHPVPQNIMDVEFKLFGALTIRQFSYAAGGFVVALLFYFSGLPDLLKWLFIGISLLTGMFLSLIKINGQPSTVWISNFITSMLEPQERLWRKTPVVPDILKDDPVKVKKQNEELSGLLSRDKMERLPEMPLAEAELPEEEKKLLDDEGEQLKKIDEHFDFLFNELPQVPKVSVNPELNKPETPLENPIVTKPDTLAAAVKTSNKVSETLYQGKDYAVAFKPMATEVNRPLIQKTNELTPQDRNYLKGTVLDANSQPVNAANVFLTDQKGTVIRNTASAAEGKFAISSPLESGDYLIDVKKEGLKFPRYTVSLKDNKILEIKLQAL